ncbi:cytochrome P450 [Zhengella sp. ZM62]|uniref:cytochrome P450 n=1 Tax=Zhengella sedimenti TaxID=3390035 RepID=UPI0039757B27
MNAHPPSFRLDGHRLHLDPHDDVFVQDPYAAYRRLHAEAPVFFWEDYGLWCVAGHAQVNALLRDRRLGRENRWGPPMACGPERAHLAAFDAVERHSLLEREPPVHTRLRALVNKAFVSRQVERLRPAIRALAAELADGLRPGDDIIECFATPVPVAVIADMLGVPRAMGPQLVSWSHRMVAMYMHGRTRADEDSANAAAAEFTGFLRSLIEGRRAGEGDDLLSVLMAARDHGNKLSEDELVTSVILLLNAGHEATVHQMGNAIRTILEQGGDPRRFFAAGEQVAESVEECLRFDAPLHMFTRHAYEPVDIGPVTLQPGRQVGLMLGAANRDPAAFEAPDAFRPGRSDQKNVTFGAGIHFCIGAPLARLELKEALAVLFHRHPDLRLAEPARYRDAYHFHGLDRLVMG